MRIIILYNLRLTLLVGAVLLGFNNAPTAQTIHYADSIQGFFSPLVEIGTLDIPQCQQNVIEEELSIREAFDLLVKPDEELFAYGVLQGFLDTILVRNSWQGAVFGMGDNITTDLYKKGFTCDENGYSYLAGAGITRIVLEVGDLQEQYLGDLPSNMHCKGGLTYRQGRFYLHSINNQLVEVNMKYPALSKVVMDFPSNILPIDALTTVQVGCDSSVTYAIGRLGNNSKVYEIDFNNWTLDELCDLPMAIVAAGSQTECMFPPCDIVIDLDNDNSSFAFRGNFCADTFCVPPVSIADTDVVITSTIDMVESVTLELADWLDAGMEYLSLATANNINVLGNNTTLLTLENNGSATIADFETAIRQVQYYNDAINETYGTRKVFASAFAGGASSLISIAELPLSNEQLSTDKSVIDPSCNGFFDGSVSLVSQGGITPYSYQWGTGQQGSILDNLPAGKYPFLTIDSLGCTRADTVTLVEPDSLTTEIIYSGFPAICDNSGELTGTATGGTAPFSYSWNNGTIDSINTGLWAGTYELTVQDANGCTATATFEILEGDTVLIIQEESICEGEGIDWDGTTYFNDTLICQVYPMLNGCDSSVCLLLTVHPLPVADISVQGNFCDQDEVTLSAGSHSIYQWSTGESSPDITTFSFGNFAVTVTNSFGCQAIATEEITPPITFDLTFENPSCFGDENGFINIESVVGGTAPHSYSIDGGVQFQENGQFENLPPGNYEVIVEDIDGCREITSVGLAAPPLITLDAGDDLEIKLGESIVLEAFTSLANPFVSWSPPDDLDCPDCLTTNAQPLVSVQYQVEVSDSNGCSAIDVVNITVTEESSVYAPTAFSPNGDGINDCFTVHTDFSVSAIKSLKIFDRWGGLLFEKKDFPPNTTEEGWDGFCKGEPVQIGVYVFVAELMRIDRNTTIISGEVNLIR